MVVSVFMLFPNVIFIVNRLLCDIQGEELGHFFRSIFVSKRTVDIVDQRRKVGQVRNCC
jgi:hypothetical protein